MHTVQSAQLTLGLSAKTIPDYDNSSGQATIGLPTYTDSLTGIQSIHGHRYFLSGSDVNVVLADISAGGTSFAPATNTSNIFTLASTTAWNAGVAATASATIVAAANALTAGTLRFVITADVFETQTIDVAVLAGDTPGVMAQKAAAEFSKNRAVLNDFSVTSSGPSVILTDAAVPVELYGGLTPNVRRQRSINIAYTQQNGLTGITNDATSTNSSGTRASGFVNSPANYGALDSLGKTLTAYTARKRIVRFKKLGIAGECSLARVYLNSITDYMTIAPGEAILLPRAAIDGLRFHIPSGTPGFAFFDFFVEYI